ncbi:MAG: hypothetical protein IPO75_11980 [Betaproteobacteria bacterium]|nr:hypothetical protein [Betaproteobacteria bacterium]
MRRLRRGYYSVRFVTLAAPPFDDPAGLPIMESFARRLEAAVREAPADWLWLQKRWKYPRPADEGSRGRAGREVGRRGRPTAEPTVSPAREAKAREGPPPGDRGRLTSRWCGPPGLAEADE